MTSRELRITFLLICNSTSLIQSLNANMPYASRSCSCVEKQVTTLSSSFLLLPSSPWHLTFLSLDQFLQAGIVVFLLAQRKGSHTLALSARNFFKKRIDKHVERMAPPVRQLYHHGLHLSLVRRC